MVVLRNSGRARLPVLTRARTSACILPFAFAVALTARTARATDPFEIQVYDGTANEPGVPGLELHTNYVVSGGTPPPLPEIPEIGQTHFTLEPSFGVLRFWEIGGYFQMAVRKDGTVDYAGIKIRNKFVTPPGWHPHWRLGINVELSLLPQAYDRGRLGGELRPIAAWENESWAFAVNPIIDFELHGPDWRAGPTFEPAASAAYKIRELVSAGLEYYSNLGPIGSGFSPLSQEEQYVFEVVNILGLKSVEINAGVGEGLTAASHSVVLKMILGYSWESAGPKRVTGMPGPRFW